MGYSLGVKPSNRDGSPDFPCCTRIFQHIRPQTKHDIIYNINSKMISNRRILLVCGHLRRATTHARETRPSTKGDSSKENESRL